MISKDTQEKIKKWEQNQPINKQLRALEDLASMMQDVINVLDDSGKESKEFNNDLAVVLLDIRETLSSIKSKEQPDFAKPIIDALNKIDFNPTIKVDAPKIPEIKAPTVKVPEIKAPSVTVDTKDLKKALEVMPEAFKEAISLIPETVIDNSDIVSKLETMVKWLESIDTASRLKPEFPSTLKVTNSDGSPIGDTLLTTRLDDASDPIIYIGKAEIGSATSSAVWQIAKLDTSSGLIKTWAGNAGFTQVWDDRAGLSYS